MNRPVSVLSIILIASLPSLAMSQFTTFDSFPKGDPAFRVSKTPGGLKDDASNSNRNCYSRQLDENGVGYINTNTCGATNDASTIHYRNWLPDGQFFVLWRGSVRTALSGAFEQGRPSGTWTFMLRIPLSGGHADDQTRTMAFSPDGNGYWRLPQACIFGNDNYRVSIAEEGRVINGLQDGLWTTFDCQDQPLAFGEYKSGKKVGPWRTLRYDPSTGFARLCQILTYEDGHLEGPYSSWDCAGSSDAHVEGYISPLPDASSTQPPNERDSFRSSGLLEM